MTLVIPTEKGADMAPYFCRNEATRTPDPYVPNVVRYQLRYIPILCKCGAKLSYFFVICTFLCSKTCQTRKSTYLCTRI